MMRPSLGLVTVLFICSMFLMIGAHVSSPVMEGDAGYNCYAHGNHVCGAPELEATAWQAWDASKESERLDPTVAHRVEYVGAALIKPIPSPGWITVSWEDGRWYVFRAVAN